MEMNETKGSRRKGRKANLLDKDGCACSVLGRRKDSWTWYSCQNRLKKRDDFKFGTLPLLQMWQVLGRRLKWSR